jgi:hypothetical protein
LIEAFQSRHQPDTLGEVEDEEVLEDFNDDDAELEELE